MRTQRWLSLALLLVTLAAAGCGGGAPKANWDVKVSGGGEPLTLTYAALTKMTQTELTDVLMQKSQGEDEVHTFSGVPLSEVFQKAGVTEYASVTALAADGYAVEISKDELAGSIIALKQDGEWIANDKDHGPIRLVCPETPANRWVFQLQELQVQN